VGGGRGLSVRRQRGLLLPHDDGSLGLGGAGGGLIQLLCQDHRDASGDEGGGFVRAVVLEAHLGVARAVAVEAAGGEACHQQHEGHQHARH